MPSMQDKRNAWIAELSSAGHRPEWLATLPDATIKNLLLRTQHEKCVARKRKNAARRKPEVEVVRYLGVMGVEDFEYEALEYRDYLKTSHWESLRTEALRRARYACSRCGATGVSLQVHHNAYRGRGSERQGDLEVLCVPCHRKHHGLLPEGH